MTSDEAATIARQIALMNYAEVLHQAFCDLVTRHGDGSPAFLRDAQAWLQKISEARKVVQEFTPNESEGTG